MPWTRVIAGMTFVPKGKIILTFPIRAFYGGCTQLFCDVPFIELGHMATPTYKEIKGSLDAG